MEPAIGAVVTDGMPSPPFVLCLRLGQRGVALVSFHSPLVLSAWVANRLTKPTVGAVETAPFPSILCSYLDGVDVSCSGKFLFTHHIVTVDS